MSKRLLKPHTPYRTTSYQTKVDKTSDSDTENVHNSPVHLIPHVIQGDNLKGGHVDEHCPYEVYHLLVTPEVGTSLVGTILYWHDR